MWLWVSAAVVAALLLVFVVWKVLSSPNNSNRTRRSTILRPPPQSSRIPLNSPPRYGSPYTMPNGPTGSMANSSQNVNQHPANYIPQSSPNASYEIENPRRDSLEYEIPGEFPYVTYSSPRNGILCLKQIKTIFRRFSMIIGSSGRLF